MTKSEIDEAVAIIGRLAIALLTTVPGNAGRAGADLRRACGDLVANAETYVRGAALSVPLLACFTQATAAGADLAGYDRVRAALLAEAPQGLAAIAVVQAALRFSLAQTARVAAALAFTSQQDVASVMTRLNAAFDGAETSAADEKDAANYRALIALHAAIVRHLADTERPLPRMVAYSFPTRLPALAMAQVIYADASRSDELVGENKIVHPAFCPSSGQALSA
jgi:prophage DNA circulation protein